MPFFRFLAATTLAVVLLLAPPASAHKEHEKRKPEATLVMPGPGNGVVPSASSPVALHSGMGEAMQHPDADRSDMSFTRRLLDWLGRTHPVIVHFPIAFFPAALFTAIVGRRRPAFGAPVQFLVIAGGIIAPVAAIFGWLDAMNADPDRMLSVHRWLGSIIGAAALGLGLWAWRRPDATRGAGMIAALTLITAAIVVQGWFGGAMVHGIDHMNW